jgi:peptidoglycan/LPS O-acetylase OafA/YrhL
VRGYQLALANPLLLFLAAISYNLYLWHQPLARLLVQIHFPPYAGDQHQDARWMVTFWFIALPLALGVSAMITYGFEQPLLRLGRRRPGARPAVVPVAPETVVET